MQKMHDWFEQINTQDVHPSQLFTYLASALNITKRNPLYIAGISIAKQADNAKEIAYHNYIHTSEAMAAMYELATAEFKNISNEALQSAGVQTKQELILIAIITMAGHDVLHDGLAERIAPPGATNEYKEYQANRLEIQSANQLKKVCEQIGIPTPTIKIMTAAIHGTAVKNSALSTQNRINYKTNPTSIVNAITQLATEADLAASISHVYGPFKGELLAIEATNADNHALATGLVSRKGREWFLKNACHLLSNGAKETGLLDELNNTNLQLEGIDEFQQAKNKQKTTIDVYTQLGLVTASDNLDSITMPKTIQDMPKQLQQKYFSDQTLTFGI